MDLILFVGGDGTARDICAEIGERIPVLGVPAGVKMQSGVFALVPEAAAEVVSLMLAAELVDLREQEVRDIDEIAYRQGVLKSRHYGEMQVPELASLCKLPGGIESDELVLVEIAAEVIERLASDVLYIIGRHHAQSSRNNWIGEYPARGRSVAE